MGGHSRRSHYLTGVAQNQLDAKKKTYDYRERDEAKRQANRYNCGPKHLVLQAATFNLINDKITALSLFHLFSGTILDFLATGNAQRGQQTIKAFTETLR